MEPRFNEPLYNKVVGIYNERYSLPRSFKKCGKDPQFDELPRDHGNCFVYISTFSIINFKRPGWRVIPRNNRYTEKFNSLYTGSLNRSSTA